MNTGWRTLSLKSSVNGDLVLLYDTSSVGPSGLEKFLRLTGTTITGLKNTRDRHLPKLLTGKQIELGDTMKSAYEVMQISENYLLVQETWADVRMYYLHDLDENKVIRLPENVPDFLASVQYAWDDFEDEYETEAVEESSE